MCFFCAPFLTTGFLMESGNVLHCCADRTIQAAEVTTERRALALHCCLCIGMAFAPARRDRNVNNQARVDLASCGQLKNSSTTLRHLGRIVDVELCESEAHRGTRCSGSRRTAGPLRHALRWFLPKAVRSVVCGVMSCAHLSTCVHVTREPMLANSFLRSPSPCPLEYQQRMPPLLDSHAGQFSSEYVLACLETARVSARFGSLLTSLLTGCTFAESPQSRVTCLGVSRLCVFPETDSRVQKAVVKPRELSLQPLPIPKERTIS